MSCGVLCARASFLLLVCVVCRGLKGLTTPISLQTQASHITPVAMPPSDGLRVSPPEQGDLERVAGPASGPCSAPEAAGETAPHAGDTSRRQRISEGVPEAMDAAEPPVHSAVEPVAARVHGGDITSTPSSSQTGSQTGTSSSQPLERVPRMTIRALLPRHSCGAILGRGGEHVKVSVGAGACR